ncbi:MAG TPA: hypothetical protein VF160_08795 [Candidatus Dormibacteraeota bacterium]
MLLLRGLALAGAALLLSVGCASSPHPSSPSVAAHEPARDPAKDTLPLVGELHVGASAHTFQGGDDHVGIEVDNRGRDFQDLVVLAPRWVGEHGLAMGTSHACANVDLSAGAIDCGPVYAGQTGSFMLRAIPLHVGTFHYELRLYDQEASGLVPILTPDGQPMAASFDEVVDPVTNQIPGGYPTPTPS